jgi:hypothetical protein
VLIFSRLLMPVIDVKLKHFLVVDHVKVAMSSVNVYVLHCLSFTLWYLYPSLTVGL